MSRNREKNKGRRKKGKKQQRGYNIAEAEVSDIAHIHKTFPNAHKKTAGCTDDYSIKGLNFT